MKLPATGVRRPAEPLISIGELCNRDVAFAMRETTIAAAAKLMRHYHVGSLVVVDEKAGMLWYQTGPYFAYYYSGRTYVALGLADTTLTTASEPAIEESWYWRAMAKAALGDIDGAIADYRTSLEWHPEFAPTLTQLQLLGVEP